MEENRGIPGTVPEADGAVIPKPAVDTGVPELPHKVLEIVTNEMFWANFWDEEEILAQRWVWFKSAILTTIYVVCFVALTAVMPDSLVATKPAGSVIRVVLTSVLAAAMLIEYGVDVFGMPKPKKDRDSFHVQKLAGKFAYLTYWILVSQTVHMVASFVAEVSLLSSQTEVFSRLLALCYTLGVFFAAVGCGLTVLFLKTVYFEEAWRQNTLQFWEDRGFPVGCRSLVSHCISLPVGVFDILVKDRVFMRTCTPNLLILMAMMLALAICYFTWLHVNWAYGGCQYWPYPILHKLGTFRRRLLLLFAIIVFLETLVCIFYSINLLLNHLL